MPSGVVYLVGAGPGAPDLLTLRAARILARADIVFHDALVHPDTIALARSAKIVAVGKRCDVMRDAAPSQGSNGAPVGGSEAAKPRAWGDRRSTAQRFIDKQIVDAAKRYAVVVRLKGGDPMLFARAQEEIAALEAAGIAYEVVPGITAALAAAASIGTSLTQRGRVRTFAFATPRSGDGETANHWADAIADVDAGAIYMGLAQRNGVAERLIAAGKPASTPVAIVVDASLPTTRVHYTTLGGLADFQPGDVSGAALLLIGPQFHARAGGMMRDGGRALAASRHAPGVTPSALRPRSRRAIRLARGASRSPCAA
jgi:uroporphyrin-III C-methyltransferase